MNDEKKRMPDDFGPGPASMLNALDLARASQEMEAEVDEALVSLLPLLDAVERLCPGAGTLTPEALAAKAEGFAMLAEIAAELVERVGLERLGTVGVPCGPINDISEVLADPQIRERNMIVSVDLPDGTTVEMAGNPIKLSAHADPPTRPPAPA